MIPGAHAAAKLRQFYAPRSLQLKVPSLRSFEEFLVHALARIILERKPGHSRNDTPLNSEGLGFIGFGVQGSGLTNPEPVWAMYREAWQRSSKPRVSKRRRPGAVAFVSSEV